MKLLLILCPFFRLENWDIIFLSHLLKMTTRRKSGLGLCTPRVLQCVQTGASLGRGPTVLVNVWLLWQNTTHWIIINRRGYLEAEKSKSTMPTSDGGWCSIMTWQRHKQAWGRQIRTLGNKPSLTVTNSLPRLWCAPFQEGRARPSSGVPSQCSRIAD